MANPKLRFKKSDGSEYPDWKEKKLNAIATCIKGANLSKADISDNGTPLILYGELYTTYSEVAKTITRHTEKTVDKKFYSQGNEVLIPTSGEDAKEISKATCVVPSGIILAGDLYILRTDVLNGQILSYILNHQANNAMTRLAQGMSIIHLKWDDLKNVIIRYPSDNKEQQQIADFFSKIDETIEATEKEIQNLELAKKGEMQKIFSQKVRFKAGDGSEYPDWEEKKLGNFIERSGKKNIEGKELDIYSVNNIKGFIPQDDQFNKAGYLQGISKTKYQIVNPSEFAYNPSRINVGSIGMLNKNEPVLISPMYEVFKASDKISKGFLNHWFGTQCFQNIVHEYSVGSVRQTLKLPSLLNAKISVPCLEEQQQIAEYLSHYDEAISAAKSELELWKKLKHGYMQQMLV